MAEFKSRSHKRVLIAVSVLVVLCISLTAGLLIHFLGKEEPEEIKHSPDTQSNATSQVTCDNNCVFTLVESIPVGLKYPDEAVIHRPTGPTILQLIRSAQESIHVAAFYLTLRKEDVVSDSSAQEGQDVFDTLYNISEAGQVKIQIVQNKPSRTFPDHDAHILSQFGSVEARSIDFDRLVGAGILHTKMLVVDKKHFYVGSANVDWRSFTQVKELGVLVENCTCLADDLEKIFQVYWQAAGANSTLPSRFSLSLSTSINQDTPLSLQNYTGPNHGSVYLSSAPPQLCPSGRTTDIDAILNIIEKAEEFIYIAVMDYMAAMVFENPETFWPVIDDALRSAAFDRKVSVRLLASKWAHSKHDMFVFLRSLNEMRNMKYVKVDLEVKIFEVPTNATLDRLPYSRVNHNKYMVTEKHLYIGTSNWSADYFVNNGGVGFVMEQPNTNTSSSNNLRHQLVDVFRRDWNSTYTHPLSNYAV